MFRIAVTIIIYKKSKMDTKHKTDKSEPLRLGFVCFLFGKTAFRCGDTNRALKSLVQDEPITGFIHTLMLKLNSFKNIIPIGIVLTLVISIVYVFLWIIQKIILLYISNI